jgi:hypothetical protein
MDPANPNWGFFLSISTSRPFRRPAHVHVLLPLGYAKGNALVELLLAEADGRSVHGADQRVIAAMFFIQERGRLGGIEAKGLGDGRLPTGKVIHLLRDVGQEIL